MNGVFLQAFREKCIPKKHLCFFREVYILKAVDLILVPAIFCFRKEVFYELSDPYHP